MAKTLLLILFVVVGLLLWRFSQRRPPADGEARNPPPQRMVRCAECGVHLPENDAVAAEGRHFCDESHRLAFSRRQPPAN